MVENLTSPRALPLLNMRQKTENQARWAGFLVVDIIYCALKKPCPVENEHNVLQQQNMHNKEEIANGFLGFLTQFCTSPLLYCFKLLCMSILPCKYSGRLPAPKERKGNLNIFLLQRHKLCLGLPETGVHSLAGCVTLLLLLVDSCRSLLCGISSCERVFFPPLFNQLWLLIRMLLGKQDWLKLKF